MNDDGTIKLKRVELLSPEALEQVFNLDEGDRGLWRVVYLTREEFAREYPAEFSKIVGKPDR